MPHVLLQSPLSLEAMRARFEALHWRSGATHVTCSRVFLGERSLLFDVYVKEPNIDQHLALLLLERRKRPGEFTLQPANYGHPRATDGLHFATNALADWLLALDDRAALIGRKTGGAEPDG